MFVALDLFELLADLAANTLCSVGIWQRYVDGLMGAAVPIIVATSCAQSGLQVARALLAGGMPA